MNKQKVREEISQNNIKPLNSIYWLILFNIIIIVKFKHKKKNFFLYKIKHNMHILIELLNIIVISKPEKYSK